MQLTLLIQVRQHPHSGAGAEGEHHRLGYEPRYTITDMIDQAAAWWRRARGRRGKTGPS